MIEVKQDKTKTIIWSSSLKEFGFQIGTINRVKFRFYELKLGLKKLSPNSKWSAHILNDYSIIFSYEILFEKNLIKVKLKKLF